MDVVDSATRSRMMSGIRGRDTKPEIIVRKLLHSSGLRFRLHVKDMPGKPDIVLPRYRAVVLVHGCFWHGHGCRLFRWPATRVDFWREKIERNRLNDERAINLLLSSGWRVAVVWECAIRAARPHNDGLCQALTDWVRGTQTMVELRE